MLKSLVAFAAYSGLALAQNNTLQFFWPHAEDYSAPAVTVQSVNASATVFNVACPSPSPSNCDWRLGVNYTIFDRTTYEATMNGNSYAVTRTCVDKGQGGVNCYAEGYDGSISSSFIANEVWAAAATNSITATITSGGEKLKAAPTSAPSSSTSSPEAGSAVISTSPTATQSQATGAAGKHHLGYAARSLVLCVGVAALYM